MRLLALTCAATLAALPVRAEPAWDLLASELFGDRALVPAPEAIVIDSPYRSDNDARTRIAAEIDPPGDARVSTVWLVLDDNPMPVSAIFALAEPMPRFGFDVTMRVNGPMPLHVVAETEDGALFVAETFVKTSGQGACSAPPGTDPDLALADLGRMDIAITPRSDIAGRLAALSGDRRDQLDIDIRHPSHSGLQMDQISLLFIPVRYIADIGISLDGRDYAGVTGSISLSENPRIGMTVPGGAQSVGVTMTDTEGTTTRADKRLPGY